MSRESRESSQRTQREFLARARRIVKPLLLAEIERLIREGIYEAIRREEMEPLRAAALLTEVSRAFSIGD